MPTVEGEGLLSLMQRCVFSRQGKGYPFLSWDALAVDLTEFHSRRLAARGSANGVCVCLWVSSGVSADTHCRCASDTELAGLS